MIIILTAFRIFNNEARVTSFINFILKPRKYWLWIASTLSHGGFELLPQCLKGIHFDCGLMKLET